MNLHPLRAARRLGLTAVASALLILATSAPSSAGFLMGPWDGPHSGHYGVHTLVDGYENGTQCVYDASHHLKKIKVHRPIVIAYNRSSGPDVQKVGWRYRIEYVDVVAEGGPYVNYPDWYVSPVMKASASDTEDADFDRQTFTFGSDSTVHPRYRVSIQMLWYYPTSTHKDGSATHVHAYYLQKDPTYPGIVRIGGCNSTAIPPE